MQRTPRFRPFETHLDEGLALAELRLSVAGADDGELFLERRRSEALRTAAWPSRIGKRPAAADWIVAGRRRPGQAC